MKDKIIAWFQAHPDEYKNVWELAFEIGAPTKLVNDALVELLREYIFKTKVESMRIGNVIKTIKDEQGNVTDVVRAEQPVTFYRWTGTTIHEQNMKNLKLKTK